MSFADTLSDHLRKRARLHAILSTFFGTVSEQAIDTNTLLILYLMLLGGGDSFSMQGILPCREIFKRQAAS